MNVFVMHLKLFPPWGSSAFDCLAALQCIQ